MQKEMVSIIVTTRNRANLLKEALMSIVKQDIKNLQLEVIVMDDNSDEEVYPTIECVSKEKEKICPNHYIKFIYEKVEDGPKGPYPNRNAAIKKATGKYIMFLDDDDVLFDKNAIMSLYNSISGKDYSFVYGDSVLYQQNGNKEFVPVKIFRLSPFSKKRLVESLGMIPLGSFMVTKHGDMPLFREDMPMSADFEWQLRMLEKYTFSHLNARILKYLRRDSGIQRSSDPTIRFKMLEIIREKQKSFSFEKKEILEGLEFSKKWKFAITFPHFLYEPVREVAFNIYHSLLDCGIETDILAILNHHELNQVYLSGAYDYILCVNPHNYIETENSVYFDRTKKTKLLAYNLEQTPIEDQSSGWASMRLQQVGVYGIYFDYMVIESESKRKTLHDMGFRTLKLDCMYHPRLDFDTNHSVEDKIYDIFFVGAESDRRKHIVNSLIEEGISVAPNQLPMCLNSRYKAEMVRKSRICLNLHFSNMEYFEKPRLFYDYLMHKAFVISEKILCPEVLVHGKDLFFAKYINILPLIISKLNSYGEENIQIGIQGYTKFKEKYHYTRVIKEFLNELAEKEGK